MTENKKIRPEVSVDVIVLNDGKILLHERKGYKTDWEWHLPGGHLEFLEEVIDCAEREVQEEMGVVIKDVKIVKILNNIYPEINKHFATFYVSSYLDKGEARVMEPEKCRSVKWFKISEMPKNLFPSLQRLVDTGYFK